MKVTVQKNDRKYSARVTKRTKPENYYAPYHNAIIFLYVTFAKILTRGNGVFN